jgi:Zn finger protein HypA/HybF involved in hydrogenase expression
MDTLMLDGNAVAGLLQQVFVAEMTTAVETCRQCGASEPIGAVQVFRGAGITLRCPHCHNLLGAIVEGRGLISIALPGMRRLSIET